MWKVALLLGVGPRFVRALLLELALVWGGVWIFFNSGVFAGALAGLMLFLFAYPARRRSILEAWAPRPVTEWMIAHGVWPRWRLAAGNLVEILVSSVNRSVAWFVVWQGSQAHEQQGIQYVRMACVLLLLHGLVSVYVNWNESARIPLALKVPPIPDKDIASIVQLVLVLTPPILFTASIALARQEWFVVTIPAALVVVATNAWITSGVEPVRTSMSFERKQTHHDWISKRPLSPTLGLLREGTRPIAKWIAVAVLVACVFVRIVHIDLDEHRFAAHGYTGLALIVAAGLVQFRWSTWGNSAEYLVASGASLTRARRIELYAGLWIGVEMILSGAIISPDSISTFRFWFGYSLLVGSALWLCNHTQLVRIGRREVRVRDLFPWLVAALFLYILGLFATVQAVVDKVTGSLSHTSTVRISKVEAFAVVTPFALFLVGAIGLWLLAFAETLDDEKLRRAELDPASR